MLVATWILAIATAVLALSGPVALFAWLAARRQDRERRQREHEEASREAVLKNARDEFVPKTWVALGAVIGVISVGLWASRDRSALC